MIPSSIHEFILIKEDGRCDPRHLNRMIKETNATVVSSKEELTDLDHLKKLLWNAVIYGCIFQV